MQSSHSDLATAADQFMRRILRDAPQYPAVASWRCWELALIRQFPLARPLLDLGCGNGGILDLLTDGGRLLSADGPVVGIDIVEDFARLAIAHDLYDGISVSDARALPFPTGAFGTVVSVCVLEHIPAVQGVLDQIARVLRPGGRFIFSVPAPPLCEVARALHEPGGEEYVTRLNERVEHVNVWDAATWEARLREAGLQAAEILGFMPEAAARDWFAAYDWTIRPIRGRGALYRLAGPELRRFGVGAALRSYWTRRLTGAARRGVACAVDDACALLIVARRP